jgi:hypothetical protein
MYEEPKVTKVSGSFVSLYPTRICLTSIENFENHPAVAHQICLETDQMEFWDMIQKAAELQSKNNAQGVLKDGFAKITQDIKLLLTANDNIGKALQAAKDVE